jgi:hypothetical protein
VSHLLRLVVPDRPGILGAVATALGEAGVDIVSVDVLERGGGLAVDDVVVELPADRPADTLITAVQSVAGVTVESLRPFVGALDTHRELDLLDALAHAGEGTGRLLAVELPRVLNAGWAALVRPAADGGGAVLARSEAAPSLAGVPLPWLPLDAPRLLPSEEDWLPERWRDMAIEMMATPFGGAGTAILVGRSGGPAFRRSELLRLAHLAGIAATVAHLPLLPG